MIYWRIGTDLTCYLKNWLQCISHFFAGDKLTIRGTCLFDLNENEIFRTNSSSTLNQNIAVWETFELCKKTGEYTILILSTQDKDLPSLIERCKAMLFIKSVDRRHQTLKETIILRILFLENKIPPNLTIHKVRSNNKEPIDHSLIKRDILAFEKEIYKDKIFVEAIIKKWGEK